VGCKQPQLCKTHALLNTIVQWFYHDNVALIGALVAGHSCCARLHDRECDACVSGMHCTTMMMLNAKCTTPAKTWNLQ
jgi:hypothetical protein